jgi:hypothetical protein
MEERAADLGRTLARYYGDGVVVEYVDVLSLRMAQFPSVRRIVDRGNVPLPVIAFNGEAKIAGGIWVEMISEELEKRGLVPLEGPAR